MTKLSKWMLASSLALFAICAHSASLTRTSVFGYDTATGVLNNEVIEPLHQSMCLANQTISRDVWGNVTEKVTRQCNGTAVGPNAGSEAPAPASALEQVSPQTTSSSFTGHTGSAAAILQGWLPRSQTNAAGHSETYEYEHVTAGLPPTVTTVANAHGYLFGMANKVTGPNQLDTRWAFDAFGRKVLELRADGSYTVWRYETCAASGVTGVNCSVVGALLGAFDGVVTRVAERQFRLSGTTAQAISSEVIQYYDALGQKIFATEAMRDGLVVRGFALFDALRRPVRQYDPFYINANASADLQPRWFGGQVPVTLMNYDAMGRVTALQRGLASGLGSVSQIYTVSTTSYSGLTTTTTEYPTTLAADQRVSSVTLNAIGKPERTVDGMGKELWQFYGPKGDLVRTQAAGVVTIINYDVRGRKRSMVDPDMGTWTYDYDVMGRLKRQVDANLRTTEMVFDNLNRMVQKTQADQVSFWQYDVLTGSGCTTGKVIGKLTRAWTQAPNATGADFDRQVCYDNLGRLITERQRFDPVGNSKPVLQTAFSYEAGSSRLLSKVLPTRPGGQPVSLSYQYHPSDGTVNRVWANLPAIPGTPASTVTVWQSRLRAASGQSVSFVVAGDAASSTSDFILRNLTLDGFQRVTKIETSYKGSFLQRDTLVYNQLDQITQRGWISADNAAENQHVENFTYDLAGRISTATISGGTSTSVTYNDAGDITSKTGVGTYNYTTGTHKLASIVGSAGGASNPIYTYDANGNILTGGGLNVSWTAANHVSEISRYGATDKFHYGPDQERIVQESPTRLTLYSLSSGMELEAPITDFCKKQVMTGCAWEARLYVQAEGKARAMLIDNSAGERYWRVMHHDHLGSVTTVTTWTGGVRNRFGYDAWGARRNASGTALVDPISSEVDRGYTGHEMLDNVGIVHMNGRLYDPQLARMISADPTIPHPNNLQAYSRYSYVYNDPLNRWDPSGYKPKWGNIIAGLAIGLLTQQWYLMNYGVAAAGSGAAAVGISVVPSAYTAGSLVTAGALGGFTGSLVASGGDFKSAATGALTGGMFGFAGALGAAGNIGGQMAMHAAAGCVSGALGGGGAEGCARGAVSQVFSKMVTIETRDFLKGNVPVHFTIAVVSGGTASAITGGKFANGAMTAAYGYLFNCVAHKCWMLPNNPESSYYRYGTPGNGAGQYAQAGALSVIFEVEFAWGAIDSRSIGIGNISLEGGGPFPPHGTHQQGLEFDVRPLRTDGAQAPVTWRDAAYDRAATQRLVDTLRATGQVDRILFNDPNIKGVTPYKGHDNHLHVKVKPPG